MDGTGDQVMVDVPLRTFSVLSVTFHDAFAGGDVPQMSHGSRLRKATE